MELRFKNDEEKFNAVSLSKEKKYYRNLLLEEYSSNISELQKVILKFYIKINNYIIEKKTNTELNENENHNPYDKQKKEPNDDYDI